MAFLNVSFELGSRPLDAVEALCFETGALSVTLSDVRDDAILEPKPGEVRLWPATRVQALFDDQASSPQLLNRLAQALQLPAGALQVQGVADRVWEREWLRDFHAMRFGQRLWVCPTHEEVTEDEAVVVRLDPGLAFGTGTHPSTALCLRWLDAQVGPLGRAIDFGCGSGILGIAAAKLGAKSVQCHDIDAQALMATRDNAARNGVSDRIQCLDDLNGIDREADLLFANILAGTLIELTAELRSMMRLGGRFVLAGILAEQEDEVRSAYASWSNTACCGRVDGWVALAGVRLA